MRQALRKREREGRLAGKSAASGSQDPVIVCLVVVKLRGAIGESGGAGVDHVGRDGSVRPLAHDEQRVLFIDEDQRPFLRGCLAAARDDLAKNRQQLLATVILMGINRIIITDGRINAKIRFQFSATENTQTQATNFDYQNMGNTTVTEGQSEYQYQGSQYSSQGGYQGPNVYSTGQYKSTTTPDVRVTSQVDTSSTGAIQATGQIMGEVNINFKSETFPLEKMVDSGQMIQLQQAQQRGTARGVPAAGAAPASGAAAPAPAAPATAPAA